MAFHHDLMQSTLPGSVVRRRTGSFGKKAPNKFYLKTNLLHTIDRQAEKSPRVY